MHAQKLATLGAMALVAALVAAAPAQAGLNTRNGIAYNGLFYNGLPVNGVGKTAFHANALSLHGLTLRDGRQLVVSK